jgi:hypothetical protein
MFNFDIYIMLKVVCKCQKMKLIYAFNHTFCNWIRVNVKKNVFLHNLCQQYYPFHNTGWSMSPMLTCYPSVNGLMQDVPSIVKGEKKNALSMMKMNKMFMRDNGKAQHPSCPIPHRLKQYSYTMLKLNVPQPNDQRHIRATTRKWKCHSKK